MVSTKVGRLLRPRPPGRGPDPGEQFPDAPPLTRVWDWSRDGIRRSLAESLARLGTDRVDIAYLHDPDDHEREVYETAYPALAELRAEGVVTAIGAGMNRAAVPVRAPGGDGRAHRPAGASRSMLRAPARPAATPTT